MKGITNIRHGRDWINPGFSVKLTIMPRAVCSASFQAGVAVITTDKPEKMLHSEEWRQRNRNWLSNSLHSWPLHLDRVRNITEGRVPVTPAEWGRDTDIGHLPCLLTNDNNKTSQL